MKGENEGMPGMRSLLRLSAPAIAAFAWRNRDELFEWAGFGLRALQAAMPGGPNLDDVKTEARLRYALANDKRTRRAEGLHVEVFDGIALLHGIVSPEVYDVAPLIAERVDGVRMVDNRLKETRRGWRPWRAGSNTGEINPAR
jgi:BON domain